MTTYRSGTLTREQVPIVYRHLGIEPSQLPRKGMALIIAVLASSEPAWVLRVTRSEHKSTYGKPLFECDHQR